jgi:mannosyl-3-phosphoglycerate phosphatase
LERPLRQTPSILFIAVDDLISTRGQIVPGFDEFTAALDHEGIPAVWVTSRSRLHFDDPRRKVGHTHPFIAEDGCGVYLPEDYFHLRPGASGKNKSDTPTVRLGRFTCLPVAKPAPAAREALESLSEETGVPVVALHTLSPRELSQNTGLHVREAELMRQHDFDEIFFFAGASEPEVNKFLEEGKKRGIEFRKHDVLWSAAIGPNLGKCIKALSGLYDRALRHHPRVTGVATEANAAKLFQLCEKNVLLQTSPHPGDESPGAIAKVTAQIPLRSEAVWSQLLALVSGKTRNTSELS